MSSIDDKFNPERRQFLRTAGGLLVLAGTGKLLSACVEEPGCKDDSECRSTSDTPRYCNTNTNQCENGTGNGGNGNGEGERLYCPAGNYFPDGNILFCDDFQNGLYDWRYSYPSDCDGGFSSSNNIQFGPQGLEITNTDAYQGLDENNLFEGVTFEARWKNNNENGTASLGLELLNSRGETLSVRIPVVVLNNANFSQWHTSRITYRENNDGSERFFIHYFDNQEVSRQSLQDNEATNFALFMSVCAPDRLYVDYVLIRIN